MPIGPSNMRMLRQLVGGTREGESTGAAGSAAAGAMASSQSSWKLSSVSAEENPTCCFRAAVISLPISIGSAGAHGDKGSSRSSACQPVAAARATAKLWLKKGVSPVADFARCALTLLGCERAVEVEARLLAIGLPLP